MFERTYTRRTLLRRSVATAGAGALVGVAGCSSIPSLVGGGGAPYANWLPVPDDVADSDHYRFTYLNLDDIESNEDEIDEDSIDPSVYEDFWDPLNIDWEDASGMTVLGFGMFGFGGFVVEADFDRDDAIEDLEDEDFDDDGEHEGYTLMLDSTESQVYAIGDGAVVLTSARSTDGDQSTGDTGTAEAVIDARTGQADRYGDDSEDMSALVGELGGGTLVSGSTTEEPDDDDPASGVFDAMVAKGQRAKINGQTTDVKHVVVYESPDDVDTDDLEEWVDDNDGSDEQFDDLDDISYNKNGRLGIITGTSDTDDL